MKRIFATLAAIGIGCTVFASPVRSDVGGRKDLGYIEEGPKNLWVWPTEALGSADAGGMKLPATVWTPEIGAWYNQIAANGYAFMSGAVMGDFGEDFVTSYISSGYGWGTFLELEPGHYVIGCETDNVAMFRFGFYNEVEGGYLWSSQLTLSRSNGAGYYERVFTVPEGTALTLVLPTSTNHETLTTTDIVIYRLD